MTRATSKILLLIAMLAVAACSPKAVPVPGATTANLTLQADVTKNIMLIEKGRAPARADPKIANTAVLERGADGASTAERWTVDRCGQPVNYRVSYVPDGQGGTYFIVAEEK